MPWLDASWHDAGWIDGPIPFDAADRGLLLADGVFDTSLVLAGRMVWRASHLRRLSAHARVIGFDVEPTRLEAAVDGTLSTAAGGHGVLRLTLTRGPGRRGLAPPPDPRPTLLATLTTLPAATLFQPSRLHPTTIRRNQTSPLSRVKSLGYGDAVLAAAEARDAGCDDALVLNGVGSIACTGIGNLFAVFGSVLVTPPLSDGVLDGITRAALLAAAGRLGLTPTERSLLPSDLEGADTIVSTNSLRLVSTISAIGTRERVVDRHAEALRAVIAEAVSADVGVNPLSLTAS